MKSSDFPLVAEFPKILPENVLQIKTKITKFGSHKPRSFRMAAVKQLWRSESPSQQATGKNFKAVSIHFPRAFPDDCPN